MDDEHKTLRDEMKQWQDRRFTVLSACAGLVGAILGLKIVGEPPPSSTNWAWSSAVLFSLLASACALTWYAGNGNAKAAAYLEVFCETGDSNDSKWETRLSRFRSTGSSIGAHKFNLNQLIAMVYLGLGLLSFFAPMQSHAMSELHFIEKVSLAVTGGLFICTLILLVREPPREEYKKMWIAIKKAEDAGQTGA